MVQAVAAHRRQPSQSSSYTVQTDGTASYPRRRAATSSLSRTPSTRSRDSSSSVEQQPRSALATLPGNLRRLPSRNRLYGSVPMGRTLPHVSHGVEDAIKVGSKRKRIVSGNENQSSGRVASHASRVKRQRSEDSSRYGSDEDQSITSEMDVDDSQQAFPSPEGSEEDDGSDDYFLQEASYRRLYGLLKQQLIRLYQLVDSMEESQDLTKAQLAQGIVDARADDITLPPSSPPGPSCSGSSDYSDDDDDGNAAGDESPTRPSPLRRHATAGNIGQFSSTTTRRSKSPLKSRSASMNLYASSDSLPQASSSKRPAPAIENTQPTRRRTISLQTRQATASLPSPPITRQRSARLSDSFGQPATKQTSSGSSKGKCKAKRVEFAHTPVTPSKRGSRSSSARNDGNASDTSDLTDLSDLEVEDSNMEATPRAKQLSKSSDSGSVLRKTPARKAKAKVGSLAEDSDISTDEELVRMNEEDADRSSSPSVPALTFARKTPLKNRLRPRPGMQTLTPPSDGDDEDDDEAKGVDEPDGIEEEEETSFDVHDLNPVGVAITPRRLRNGKIVGEELLSDEEDEDEVEAGIAEEDEEEVGAEIEEEDEAQAEESASDGDVTVTADVDDVMVDDDEAEPAEVDDDEELTEGDDELVDDNLTGATTKSLMRLRRDQLVQLCQDRDIEPEGTKPQLTEALLKWRSQQEATSPSSTCTVRPGPSVRELAGSRRKSSRNSQTRTPVPVLLRSHIHVHQPSTPPVSAPDTIKEGTKEGEDGELELDLSSLGLEEREIPCDKLLKLEKIGSGGFKDVFIGKWKNRKVAISEFRGSLTAMDIKELKLLGGFDHPNIVRFLGVSIPENTKETPVMIISELCSNGDLFDYVRNVPAPKLSKVLNLMLDIAKGLEYLHLLKPSIIHRDCKSSNILITSRVHAKIADFGLAKVKQSTRSMVRSLVGTVNWQAPELWSPSPKYNHKVDVFSCAMVFWEMLQWHLPNKKFPWEGMNEHAIYDVVGAKRQRPSISGLKKQWCPEVVELMERMWAHEHQDRPTISQVVEEIQRLVQLYR